MPAKSFDSQKQNTQRMGWKAFFEKLLRHAFSAFPSELKSYSRAEIFMLRFTPPAKDDRPEKQK